MSQFNKEIPQRTPKEQLQLSLKTHNDNLADLKQAIKMFSNAGDSVLSGYIHTLESDILIMKETMKRL